MHAKWWQIVTVFDYQTTEGHEYIAPYFIARIHMKRSKRTLDYLPIAEYRANN